VELKKVSCGWLANSKGNHPKILESWNQISTFCLLKSAKFGLI